MIIITPNPLLGIHHIPIISPEATSDELNSHMDHAYFFRMVSPDKYLATAMVDILSYYNWTYFSLIYTANIYGTNGANQILRISRERNLCIGYTKALNDYMTSDEEFDLEVANLRRYGKAKAVLVFTSVNHANRLMQAVQRQNAGNEFIWIGCDGFDERSFKGLESAALGAFQITFSESFDNNYTQYFESLTPWNNNNNPWYSQLWENNFGCSFSVPENDPTYCSTDLKVTSMPGYYTSGWTGRSMDSVQVGILWNNLHCIILSAFYITLT